jgi:hypothetical protein
MKENDTKQNYTIQYGMKQNDIKQNDINQNDTKQNDTIQYGMKQNDMKPNNTLLNDTQGIETKQNRLSWFVCRSAMRHLAECRSFKCRTATKNVLLKFYFSFKFWSL